MSRAEGLMALPEYVSAFARLKVNKRRETISPHKPCMLLAVMELAEAGLLAENKIYFSPPLLERYRLIFDVVRSPSDHPNPYFPFFHLQGDGFWRLIPKRGREAVSGAMRSARSASDILTNIECAVLDPPLHELMLNPRGREHLRETIVSRWFPRKAEVLKQIIRHNTIANRYEYKLRSFIAGEEAKPERLAQYEQARASAFRRIVTQAYDYRCAASGWRIILPDDAIMVEAAHLIPFAESRDDDPRNGVALAPSYHWALDKWVIAPGPDHRWHVSRILDERLPDNRPLLDLEGKPIILPRDKRFWPKEESLEWRIRRLVK